MQKNKLYPEVTIVTVVFRKELPLLHLQARSIKLFAKINLCKIIVITNDDFSKNEIRELDHLYKKIFKEEMKVEIISGEKLIYKGYLNDILGWRAQQILKLIVCRNIESTYYLTLDSKNHLIRPLNNRDLFYKGKPIAYVKKFPGPFWKEYIINCVKLFDLSHTEKLDYFMIPATPYMLITEEVNNLFIFLELKKLPVIDAISKNGTTEFLLYYFYLVRNNKAKTLYSFKRTITRNSVSFFSKGPLPKRKILEKIELLNNANIKWLAVHRQRFMLGYEADIKNSIVEIWSDSGLFKSVKSAKNFWNSYQSFLLNKN